MKVIIISKTKLRHFICRGLWLLSPLLNLRTVIVHQYRTFMYELIRYFLEIYFAYRSKYSKLRYRIVDGQQTNIVTIRIETKLANNHQLPISCPPIDITTLPKTGV